MANQSSRKTVLHKYFASLQSQLGEITLGSDGENLTGCWLPGQVRPVDRLGELCTDLPIFSATRAWFEQYFSAQAPTITLPLAPTGTDFQQLVWKVLPEIAFGKTVSYQDVADMLAARGRKTSPRAVGGAVSKNPIAVIIPCHRVIGKNHDLVGYYGGVKYKQALLKLEGIKI